VLSILREVLQKLIKCNCALVLQLKDSTDGSRIAPSEHLRTRQNMGRGLCDYIINAEPLRNPVLAFFP